MVGVVRFERTTSCTQSRPSTKLRYTPVGAADYTRPRRHRNARNPRVGRLPVMCNPLVLVARNGDQLDVELDWAAIRNDEPIPREVSVPFDRDAMLTFG